MGCRLVAVGSSGWSDEFILDVGTFEKMPVLNSLEASPFLHRGLRGIMALAVRSDRAIGGREGTHTE